MTAWCAALFVVLGSGDLPTEMAYAEPPIGEREFEDGLFLRPYGGVWASRRFRFEATDTSGNTHLSASESLGSVGLDGGVRFAGHVVAFATIEGDFRKDIRSELGGLSLGYRDSPGPDAPPGIPDEIMVYAGAIGGQFDVTTPGFGNFRDSVGGRLGLTLSWKVIHRVDVGITAEWRYIHFAYEPAVMQGNTRIGDGTYWLGAKVEIRF